MCQELSNIEPNDTKPLPSNNKHNDKKAIEKLNGNRLMSIR